MQLKMFLTLSLCSCAILSIVNCVQTPTRIIADCAGKDNNNIKNMLKTVLQDISRTAVTPDLLASKISTKISSWTGNWVVAAGQQNKWDLVAKPESVWNGMQTTCDFAATIGDQILTGKLARVS